MEKTHIRKCFVFHREQFLIYIHYWSPLSKKSIPSGFFNRYTPVNNFKIYFYPHDIKTHPIKSQWEQECLIRCVYLVTSFVQTKDLKNTFKTSTFFWQQFKHAKKQLFCYYFTCLAVLVSILMQIYGPYYSNKHSFCPSFVTPF